MRQLRAWALRFKGMFSKDAGERELADELESHLRVILTRNTWACYLGSTVAAGGREIWLLVSPFQGVRVSASRP